MAVELTATDATFTGTGVLSTYSPQFYVNSSDQVRVTVDDVPKTLGDDYTLSGVGDEDGVDVLATFALNSAVYVERVTPITQEVDTQNNETVLEDVLDAEFDKLTMIDQEQQTQIGRTLRAAKGEPGLVLPKAALLAGISYQFIGINPATGQLDRMLINQAFKGDPGGNAMAVGLFTVIGTLSIPVGTDMIHTSGWNTVGQGDAFYVYDAAIDAAYVAAHSRSAVISLNGRGFKLNGTPNVMQYGAKGDGVALDHAAFIAAATENAGKTVFVPDPAVAYLLGATLGQMPADTNFLGFNKQSCKIRRGFNGGYLVKMADGVGFDNLWFDGNGTAGFTGGNIEIDVGQGNQNITNCKSINCSGIALHIICTGAASNQVGSSRNNIDNCEMWSNDAAVFAITHDDPGVPAAGHPIAINHLETGGKPSIDFGACNDLYISNSTLFSMKWSANSRGILIVSSRAAGAGGYTILGGCKAIAVSWGSLVTVGANAACMLMGDFNNGWVDNSGGAGACFIFDYTLHTNDPAAPDMYGGVTLWTKGSASATSKWTRTGQDIDINFSIVGQTNTVLPAGQLSITVPFTASGDVSAFMLWSGTLNVNGNSYQLNGRLVGGTNKILLTPPTGIMTNTLPETLNGIVWSIQLGGRYTLP